MMYRTYLEFCPHGDLGQWTGWYKKRRKEHHGRWKYLKMPEKPEKGKLPPAEYKAAAKKYREELEEFISMRGQSMGEIAAEFHAVRDTLERDFLPES